MHGRPNGWRAAVLAAVGVGALCLVAAAEPIKPPDEPGAGETESRVSRLEIALKDGKVDLRELARTLCEALGVDYASVAGDRWMIDLSSMARGLGAEKLAEATNGAVRIDVCPEKITITIDRAAIGKATERTWRSVAGWLDEQFGRARGPKQPGSFGLTFVTAENERAPLTALVAVPQRTVVLIHGLDDPGWMWRDVIPRLVESGAAVARFEYPNDGPIADSTDMLAVELAKLRSAGVQRVDLIGHSMGGLLARDVLTRTTHYNGDGAGNERLPAVDRLIMIGTPNHGSQMARLRQVSELGEHLSRLLGGEQGSMDTRSDGGGEAGVDLLPDSDFLRRLNARPLAGHTKYTIIAGRASPLSEDEVRKWSDRLISMARSERAPQWLRDLTSGEETGAVSDALAGAVRGLGDGAVTVDSTKLEGVDDFVLVEGDHVSMLVNVLSSSRTPPALPVILERLKEAPVDP